MKRADKSLRVCQLAENGFRSGHVHESETNDRGDTSGFTHGADDLLVLHSQDR